ncbi:MAG: PQQ-binding-like beta-propeller repeat protein [Candidatus Bathyarchaeia archaeon]|jgi:hypothetical protein
MIKLKKSVNTVNKTKLASTILIMLFITSTVLIFNSAPVEAQPAAEQPTVTIPNSATPEVNAETLAHLSFRPRVVGLGQPFIVNIWLQSVTLGANYKYYDSFKVTITKPDGTQDVIIKDSYVADATAWFEYTADQVGEWSIKFDFLGQYFPNGTYFEGVNYPNVAAIGPYEAGQFGRPAYFRSTYYQPSSDGPYNLTVQADPVKSWPTSELPTGYWTRPVTTHNREWWSILGNYPATGIVGGGDYWPQDTNTYAQPRYGYLPYVTGPTSAHVLWKRPFNIGGLVGGTMGTQSIWESARVIYGHPTLIYSGRAYWTTTKVVNGQTQSVWQCYDIRTGEVYWEKYPAAQTPTFLIYDAGTAEIVDAVPHLATVYLGYIGSVGGNGYFIKYDPWNGNVVGNYSIAPLTTSTYFAEPYAYGVQNQGGGKYALIKWDTSSTSTNFTSRIVSNVTWPISSLPATVDYEAGLAVSASASRIVSYSLETGQVVANITTGMAYATEGTPAQVDHGKIAQRYNDGYWHCWDIRTGQYLWKNELSSYPWGTFGTYGSCSYGGMIMSNQFDSVTAINWTNGKIVWTYYDTASSPYETPYTAGNETVNPWHACGMIAGGIYYTMNAEHSADMPIKRGWRMHAINITTGEKVWSFAGTQSGSTDGSRVFQGAIADGYLAYSDAYTCMMYVIGKGQSETTITAPDVDVTLGSGLMIRGTVLDLSPAQPGTACVSKDSMTTVMESIHLQLPITGIYNEQIIEGVPVSIDAVDSNGNAIHIATITSDGYSGIFGYNWKPETAGQYTITATFAGDDSYGSSYATTYVNVAEAPEETQTPTTPQTTQTPYELYTVGTGIAVIAAIALAVLILRKKP